MENNMTAKSKDKSFLLLGLIGVTLAITSEITREDVQTHMEKNTGYENIVVGDRSWNTLYFYKFEAKSNNEEITGYVLPGMQVGVSKKAKI